MDQLVTPLLAGGGVVGLFLATGIVLRQLLSTNAQLTKERDKAMVSVRADLDQSNALNRRCERNLARLVAILLRHGIDIPPEIFE